MYSCYSHNWFSHYDDCPKCRTYETTTSDSAGGKVHFRNPNDIFKEQAEADKEFNLQLENLKLKSQLSKLREVSEKMCGFINDISPSWLPQNVRMERHVMCKLWQAFLESEK